MFRTSKFRGDISNWDIHPNNAAGRAYVENSKLRHRGGISSVAIPRENPQYPIITELKELSEASKGVSLESKMLKLMEEVGEASQALLKQNGSYNASDSNSNFLEEMVDISLIVGDILHRIDPTGVNVPRIQSEKLKKWRSRFK